MHLADGILTEPAILVGLDLVGGGAVAIAARRAGATGRLAAWTGCLGAFLLAAQAVNVPLLPGTSAHVVGTGLVTLLLGPSAAIVTLTAVLLVQALLFGDGGVTVLGLNALDLAVLPALSVQACVAVFGRSERGLVRAALAGTVLGSLAGAACLGAALVLGAGARPLATLPWLLGAQGLAGLGEGLLTAVAVREILKRAPRLFAPVEGSAGGASPFRPVVAWAVIAAGVASLLVPFASQKPDALERLLPDIARHP